MMPSPEDEYIHLVPKEGNVRGITIALFLIAILLSIPLFIDEPQSLSPKINIHFFKTH